MYITIVRMLNYELFHLLAYTILSTVMALISTNLAWNRQNRDNGPLKDLLFDIIPDISYISIPISNYIGFVQIILLIASFRSKERFRRILQYIFLQSTTTIIRSITVSFTTLPNIFTPNYCNETPRNLYVTFCNMLIHGTCGDYMYSGHTATAVLVFLFGYRYSKSTGFIFMNGVLSILLISFLLLQRWHYTIDCIIATLIITLIFQLYMVTEKYENYWFYFKKKTILDIYTHK